MKLPFSQRTWSSIGVVALVLILALLAVLQYRWSRDVSEAAGARMRASLQSSMMRFREDFSRELTNLAVAIVQPDSQSPSEPSSTPLDYVQRITSWRRTAAHPNLLLNIYVLQTERGNLRLLRLDQAKGQFQVTEWPPSLSPLKEPLTNFVNQTAFFEHHGPMRPDERGPGGPPMFFRGPRMPWMFDEHSSVLLSMQVNHEPMSDFPPSFSWVLLELNENVITEQIFPQLAQAHFTGTEGLDYDVAVVDRSNGNSVIYESNSAADGVNRPDGEIGLLGGFAGPNAQPGMSVVIAGEARDVPPHGGPGGGPRIDANAPRFATFGPTRLERFRFGDRGPGWQLVAKHHKGSLEAALQSMHRRQLAISFGVLLLLAATMTMIIVASRRAQRLAKLQMDFVTGVSHELRTPLAVIGSAAENIADGIIDDKQKIARYGTVIRDSARQLTRLVEQILLFAATRQENYHYHFSQVQPFEIIKLAVDNSAELMKEAGFTLEQDIASNLPPVLVDLPAVSHCLQNLISNAVKYGGDTRWIRISAIEASTSDGREVRIAVQDKGIGIASSDLERIFDPFYRSPAVANAQIHGTGLGLALAKGIAEGMHGHLSVTSEAGKGSTFVLHLPITQSVMSTVEEKFAHSNIDYEPEHSNR